MRRTTVAPARGTERRSVSLPEREPLVAVWGRMGTVAPRRSVATMSGLTQIRLAPAIRIPADGRFWDKAHKNDARKILRLPALMAGQEWARAETLDGAGFSRWKDTQVELKRILCWLGGWGK